MNLNQQTIRLPIKGFGIGIHSGEHVEVNFLPAEPDTGIIFRKKDKLGNHIVDIEARYDNVCSTIMCTTICSQDKKNQISTIEHLMAALLGCGVDNMIIEINHDEVPIMDGSAEQFVFMIECAGLVQQNKGKKIIEILKEIKVTQNDSFASLAPAHGFLLDVEIDFNDNVIKGQKFSYDENTTNFKMEVSRARTFGFEHEIAYLKERGLAKGGSLENAIVVGKDNILNSESLRYHNEFARHKLLDCMGDLYLAGHSIKGKFAGYKCGHALNNCLLHALFADKDAWKIVELPIQQN